MALFLFGITSPAAAENLLVSVNGMDCVTCQPKLETAFRNIAGVESVKASKNAGAACVATIGDTQPTVVTFQESLKALPEYQVTKVAIIETCPFTASKARKKIQLWSQTEGLDVEILSTREPFEMAEAPVAGKFTIVDFGADWCGPCKLAEKTLKKALAENENLAVRAVTLEGNSPKESFALPVSVQHLKNAAGLPHFLLFGPDGDKLYQGQNLDKALGIVSKKSNK